MEVSWKRHGSVMEAPRQVQVADLEESAQRIDAALKGRTAGANALHRVLPLATARCIGDDELAGAARQESRLTHWSRLSGDACAAAAFVCRRLVHGESWDGALRAALASGHRGLPLGGCP